MSALVSGTVPGDMPTQQEIIRQLIPAHASAAASGEAFAPANIALCKYWGKRNGELNLPVTSSLSISLGHLGSRATLSRAEDRDHCVLNGEPLSPDSNFHKRAAAYLNLFRPAPDFYFRLAAENTIPTAAGFASSASGFAAVALALDHFFGWRLNRRALSILARLGSGSAARSVYDGFVEWQAGRQDDGMDSYAERLEAEWPDLRVGLLVICADEKAASSRAAMKRTVETCMLYKAWPDQVMQDLGTLKRAIQARDFDALGAAAEGNALAMHATMIATWPPVLYWKPESVAAMDRVWKLRSEGLPVYFTMDAGPNLKLLFTAEHEEAACKAFPGLKVVQPFGLRNASR